MNYPLIFYQCVIRKLILKLFLKNCDGENTINKCTDYDWKLWPASLPSQLWRKIWQKIPICDGLIIARRLSWHFIENSIHNSQRCKWLWQGVTILWRIVTARHNQMGRLFFFFLDFAATFSIYLTYVSFNTTSPTTATRSHNPRNPSPNTLEIPPPVTKVGGELRRPLRTASVV